MPGLSKALQRQFAEVAKVAQKLSVPQAGPTPGLSKAKNIFLIRSAAPEHFKKCVNELKKMAPQATLHVVSHERDRELIAGICKEKFKFYPYTSGGNYSVQSMAPLLPSLLKANIDTFIMLANNVYGYPHIAEILYTLGAQKLYLFNINERWYVTTREELEFRTAASAIYLNTCKLLFETQSQNTQGQQKRVLSGRNASLTRFTKHTKGATPHRSQKTHHQRSKSRSSAKTVKRKRS